MSHLGMACPDLPRDHARLAIEETLISVGINDRDLLVMKGLLEATEKHWSWNQQQVERKKA